MAERLDPNKWHGWVHPLPSGAKARCGGPGLCSQCSQELAETYRMAYRMGVKRLGFDLPENPDIKVVTSG
jgi:hypothetical protein